MTLEDLTFAGDPLRALAADFRKGHMPPVTLFAGESGIGKKTAARLFAKALVCASGSRAPCGACRACLRFDAGTHSSVLRPDADASDKTVKIDAMRRLLDQLSRSALEGGNRAVLIENAERMTPQTQNCLLKTLEESANDTYFLLTADSESALLATVRSRCRIVRMQPWSDDAMRGALRAKGVPEARIGELTVLASGSIGKALAMQGDETYWACRALVRDTFLAIAREGDIPLAAKKLAEQKEQDARVLDILEEELSAMLRGAGERTPAFEGADDRMIGDVMDRTILARRMRAANVGWPAVADQLLRFIAEEQASCQA